MKIKKILDRLLLLHPKAIDLSLNRIKRLLKDLKNPQKLLKNCIQVIGTNGKFSICSTLREIFETAGYTVNLNISPSLRKFNERYYFSGKNISDDKLFDLLTEVEKINKGQKITFHEFICACFFLEASRNQSDINILESGLFFRLDASNVLEKNIASIITPIGVDHKDFLKEGTIDEIVYEKCSHLVEGSKIIVSEQKNDVLKKIKKNIKKNSSKKLIFNENYTYQKINNGFIYKDKNCLIKLPLPNLLGDFQLSNISTAIAAIKSLNQFKITELDIIKAITKIRSEGRIQNIKKGKLKDLSKDNTLIIDGSHNPLGASVLRKYLDSLNNKRKIYMILGMLKNKDHKNYVSYFKNKVESITAVDIPNQNNSLKKESLKKIIDQIGIDSDISKNINQAIVNISRKEKNSIILITGSLYLAGEVLNLN